MGKHIKQKNDISCTDEICTILRSLPYRFTVDGTKKKNHDLQEYCVKLYHQITCMLFYFCSIKDMALGLLT